MKSEQKYNEILKLAKENADSNEFCIQELEKENEQLKALKDKYYQMTLDDEIQINELMQENKELKKAYSNLNAKYNDNCDYTSRIEYALEDIREMAKYDCVRECSNNNENCTIESCLEKRIQRKIDEVLE